MNTFKTPWQGTFIIWQNKEFSQLYAQFTGRQLYELEECQIYVSQQLVIGKTTLYLYNVPAQKQWLAQLTSLAKKLKAAKIWIYSIQPLTLLSAYFKKEVLTLIIDLTDNQEKLWQKIGAKTRNMIRKGQRQGTGVKLAQTDRDFKKWWSIYTKLTQRQNFNQQNFELVKQLFKNQKLAKLFLSVKNKQIIGGTFFLIDQYPMYWLGAFDYQHRHFAPGHINIWQAMLYLKENGYPLLDLGGASLNKNDGSSRFKKSFQGEIKKAYIYEIPVIHWKYYCLSFLQALQKLRG